jgi:hypothetical protein
MIIAENQKIPEQVNIPVALYFHADSFNIAASPSCIHTPVNTEDLLCSNKSSVKDKK